MNIDVMMEMGFGIDVGNLGLFGVDFLRMKIENCRKFVDCIYLLNYLVR